MNRSPLRYPGGKSKLTDFLKLSIEKSHLENCTYIEPFAGGAGAALALLFDGVVDRIVINDYDKAIYALWRAIKEEPEQLIDKIQNTPITIEEWYAQKQIYTNSSSYSLDLAFATLFLNRTNRSGILNAGPIGGYAQDGNWKLDVRFNKNALIEKIQLISNYKNCITIYNKDVISLIRNYLPKYGQNVFIYFDPPYYNKGKELYKNFFTPNHHRLIRELIVNEVKVPWVVTYDNVDEIRLIYDGFCIKTFDLTYSVANKGTSSELMIFSNEAFCPEEQELKDNNININLR